MVKPTRRGDYFNDHFGVTHQVVWFHYTLFEYSTWIFVSDRLPEFYKECLIQSDKGYVSIDDSTYIFNDLT